MGRVLVVGSVNVDLVVAGQRLPGPGETVVGGTFRQFHGGKGGNQAVAAARLGARTVLVAALGDDGFGSEAREALRSAGVALDVLVTLDDVPSGVALILVDAVGENLIAVAPGANRELSPGHVADAFDRLRPHAGDVVLVTHEILTGTAQEALRRGREAGATTVLNPAPADGIESTMLELADVLTPNRGELLRLAAVAGGAQDGEAADPRVVAGRLAGATGADVLVSLGADGAVLVTRDGSTTELPAPRVTAVDATGAGDALNGALAAELAAGRSLADAARRAVIAASLSVTRPGAREGMPSRIELDAAAAAG